MTIFKKKYTVGIVLIAMVVFLIGFQFLFLKNIFGINPFTQDILPKGFCKDCNVILISLDTLRAKSLPFYGYDKNTSPNLFDFANKSFLFKNTYSQSAYTLDSHFSIFTSLYASSHKMTVPFVSNLSESIITLPQIFKQNGYETYYLGVTKDFNLPLNKGLGRGFDHEILTYDPDGWIKGLKIQNLASKKFFAFLHTYRVHEPYIPKKENISKFYSGELKTYISSNELNLKSLENVKLLIKELNLQNVNSNKHEISCNSIFDCEKYFYTSGEDFNKFYNAK